MIREVSTKSDKEIGTSCELHDSKFRGAQAIASVADMESGDLLPDRF